MMTSMHRLDAYKHFTLYNIDNLNQRELISSLHLTNTFEKTIKYYDNCFLC